ncbi:MAG TPA: hypothetical protein VH744_11235 [Terriglobales bacterium]|jgi:hypothetical protein
MSKDAQTAVVLNEDAQEKFEQCVAALAACGFGSDGPAVNTTFAEIERFGHEVGRMVARGVGERLTAQHAEHFQDQSACPVCQTPCAPKEDPAQRRLQTIDGHVPLAEPVCHCPVCHRDFFPSA